MTPEQKLAALKEMCEKATKGPWSASPYEANEVQVFAPTPFLEHKHCDCFDCRGEETDHGCLCGSRVWPCPRQNSSILMMLWPEHEVEETRAAEVLWYDTADFIAASRTLLPAALKVIEEVGEMHKAEPRDMQRTGARGQFCVECYSAPWPCPTRRLIDAFWEEVKI